VAKVPRNAPCPCGSGKKFKHCHGLKRPLPTAENIASVSFNPEAKRAAIVTKDILINQISRDGPSIAKSFDRLTKNDIRAISAVVADAVGLLFRHILVGTEDYKPTCARLLSSTLTTFMASIEVAQHGFRRPYGAMVRNIVEGIAAILHISIQPAALQRFHAGKLESTKSIAVAKKVLPPFGQVYGALSRHFVHINTSDAGLEPIVEYKKDENALRFIVSSLKMNALLINIVGELIFHNENPTPRYWRHLGHGGFAYDPSDAERAWLKQFLGDRNGPS
jgi:hypothetical protein